MKSEFVAIAQDKNADPAAVEALARIHAAVDAYERAQTSLPARIRASQAARGAEPVRLRADEAAMLAELAQDEAAGHAAVREQLRALATAQEVVGALAFALENDLPAARAMLRHAGPERPLFEELIALEETALASMRAYLEAFAGE